MDELEASSLRERVARLETEVAELRRAFVAPQAPARTAGVAERVGPRRWTPPEFLWDAEFWLNKLGIGLLLLGVAFLFRYSIEQGWLTPLVQVLFGLILGVTLLLLGLRMDPERRRFTPVLLGGAIGVFYTVGFAAFQFYALVGHTTAFVGMAAVTLLAFLLAMRREQPVPALIGALGGLGTPFLLYDGRGSLPGVLAYTCLVLALTTALFAYRGWRSLLWTGIVGGWTVLVISYGEGLRDAPAASTGDRIALQAAILFAWVAFGVVPILRELLRLRPLAEPRAAPSGGVAFAGWDRLTELHVHLVSATTPLLPLVLSRSIWSLSGPTWGWLVITCAAAYALAAAGLIRGSRMLAEAHLLAAALLLVAGTLAALEGAALLAVIALEAAALHHLGRRLARPLVSAVAHLLAGGVALALLARLGSDAPGALADSVAELTAIALMFAASTRLRAEESWIYRSFVHVAFLGWLWRQLDPLPNGAALVSVAWGVYAICLLVAGLRQNHVLVQKVAIGTLLLVVAKLFLVDLAALDALYRIVLFLGLGGLFLFLSYALQTMWKTKPGSAGR